MQTNDILLMKDVVIYIYENDLEPNTEKLCSMTGATIFD
jgi:hypothetical protein